MDLLRAEAKPPHLVENVVGGLGPRKRLLFLVVRGDVRQNPFHLDRWSRMPGTPARGSAHEPVRLCPMRQLADRQLVAPLAVLAPDSSRESDMPIEIAAELGELLLAGRNPDGGWGYYAGKSSRLEPTCWALLSLLEVQRPDDMPIVDAGLRLIVKWQRESGLVAEPQLPPNLAFNGLVLLVLTAAHASLDQREYKEVRSRLTAGIVGVRSKTAWNWNSPVRQDNSLVGWPWTEDAYGWVEPTAWCTLGLKKARLRGASEGSQERIEQAERLLLDRQCAEGGWNYGNGEVLGQTLHAYVPTTAVVLLALQDRRRRAEVERALGYLLSAWPHELAGLALALSLLCFRTYALPTADVETALATAWQKSEFLGNQAVAAMVRYALTTGMHGTNALAL